MQQRILLSDDGYMSQAYRSFSSPYSHERNIFAEFCSAIFNQYKRELAILFVAFDVLLGLTLFSDVQLHVFKDTDKAVASAAVAQAAQASAVATPPGPTPLAAISSDTSWPIQGHITAEFGDRTTYQRHHSGIDISSYQRAGRATVHPIRVGTVTEAGRAGGLGNRVVIDHGDGVAATYAHLDSIDVSPGQIINPDESIGKEGSTGNSTGPHLHLEIRKNGQLINPREVLNN